MFNQLTQFKEELENRTKLHKSASQISIISFVAKSECNLTEKGKCSLFGNLARVRVIIILFEYTVNKIMCFECGDRKYCEHTQSVELPCHGLESLSMAINKQ